MIRLMTLFEASYEGNVGVMELVDFYKKASATQKQQLEKYIKQEDYKKAWALVQQVTKVKLRGM